MIDSGEMWHVCFFFFCEKTGVLFMELVFVFILGKGFDIKNTYIQKKILICILLVGIF